MEPPELFRLPGYAALQKGYERMWAAGASDIRTGTVDADPVPTETTLRWGISVIATVQPPLDAALAGLAESCRRYCGDNHTFYQRANTHITVRSCEFYRADIAHNDPAVHRYRTALAEVGGEHDPFEIAYCGVNANRTGVIVQGYPVTNTLQQIREALHLRLVEVGAQRGPEHDGVRRTAHSSIMVFGGALADPAGLHGWLTANRETEYGKTWVTQLSLVRYIRTAHDVALVPLAGVALARL